MAVDAAADLEKAGMKVRVVSMPCTELFDEQSAAYKESVLPKDVRARVSVEAGATYGWEKYTGTDGAQIGIDTFGASAPRRHPVREVRDHQGRRGRRRQEGRWQVKRVEEMRWKAFFDFGQREREKRERERGPTTRTK